jgi:hypothetical protein
MLNLTEVEVRALTPPSSVPEIRHDNCKPGVTPDEIRGLIAESRARVLGRRGVEEVRNQYQRQHGTIESAEEKLASISVF